MQHAVDPKAHATLLTAGLQVDIAGALFKGVLKQPVDDIDDVRIVGIRFPLACAQGQQLFEIGRRAGLLIVEYSPIDRFGQLEKLYVEALDFQGVGNDTSDRALERLAQIGLPTADPGLGVGNCDG